METRVQKWGNSLALRIPNSYAKDINLNEGSVVDIYQEDEKLIVKPKKNESTLKDLLSRVSEDNIHNEIYTGDNVGKEIW